VDAAELAGKYDAHYYAHNCGSPYARDAAWLGLFAGIADRLVSDVLGGGPDGGAVLDAGCAWGLLVEALRERGVEAYGLEVSDYALANVAEEVRPYCAKGSIADPLPRRYRLVVCIEVLEHMTSQDAERALANICAHTDDVLFSSTPFDYKEATHVNVQPPERWGELFARHGFFRDVEHDASYITPWAVRFRRRNEPLPRLVRDYERKYFLLWKENVDLRRGARL
jgi:hypothetical protein